jgi:hypothetical protein
MPEFSVLADGSLFASSAKISGGIYSTYGEIAGWKISENGLSYGAIGD